MTLHLLVLLRYCMQPTIQGGELLWALGKPVRVAGWSSRALGR
jgi:hypothetical protein